jgi:hypothetical protein
VKAKIRRRFVDCKRRIQRRLFRDRNVHYKIGERTWGPNAGGDAVPWPAVF